MEKEQLLLFGEDTMPPEVWQEHWRGMPEFKQEDLMPYQQIIVSFESKKDVEEFSKLINQKLTYKTKSVRFPKKRQGNPSDYRYIRVSDEE